MSDMYTIIFLAMIALGFGGVMNKSGMLHSIVMGMMRFVNSTGNLVSSALASGIVIIFSVPINISPLLFRVKCLRSLLKKRIFIKRIFREQWKEAARCRVFLLGTVVLLNSIFKTIWKMV